MAVWVVGLLKRGKALEMEPQRIVTLKILLVFPVNCLLLSTVPAGVLKVFFSGSKVNQPLRLLSIGF